MKLESKTHEKDVRSRKEMGAENISKAEDELTTALSSAEYEADLLRKEVASLREELTFCHRRINEIRDEERTVSKILSKLIEHLTTINNEDLINAPRKNLIRITELYIEGWRCSAIGFLYLPWTTTPKIQLCALLAP